MTEEVDYRSAGVDIEAGEKAVERIKGLARSTFRPEVLQEIGSFGGLFAPDLKGLDSPVLVAGCDGVGTKLKLAFTADRHDTIGIDCVAMCVNDILVQGAEPLFFLDYLAVGKLLPDKVEQIVSGVAEGCRQAGCALLGGEMAEMPGFYQPGEYDLAGFAVGIVNRPDLVDGSKIAEGDAVIGLASNGLHSNGFSLARRVLLEKAGLQLTDKHPVLDSSLADEMLKPTAIYVKPVLKALKSFLIKGMAHITGGGLPGNILRILPEGLQVILDSSAWPVPPVFQMISKLGPVKKNEMLRTFNMGIGYCLVVAEEQAKALTAFFAGENVQSFRIGKVVRGEKKTVIFD